MKIWLPYIKGGSGTDTFTERLAESLASAGHQAILSEYPHWLQYAPWLLKKISPPGNCDVILTNSWNGFAFKRQNIPLFSVEHLFVLDPALTPYKSILQSIFHKTFVRGFEHLSNQASDKIIAVSHYTANVYREYFGGDTPTVISNGIDIDFFCPPPSKISEDKRFRLLFAGNLIRRKGADLLPEIMERLGNEFVLYFTSGRKKNGKRNFPENMVPLGKIDRHEMREQYQKADLLLFPSRLEGLPLVVLEAMACGTPVISHESASLPEIINQNTNGYMCPRDSIDCFITKIKELKSQPDKLAYLALESRKKIISEFTQNNMTKKYIDEFNEFIINE